jgi:hypothetical protein
VSALPEGGGAPVPLAWSLPAGCIGTVLAAAAGAGRALEPLTTEAARMMALPPPEISALAAGAARLLAQQLRRAGAGAGDEGLGERCLVTVEGGACWAAVVDALMELLLADPAVAAHDARAGGLVGAAAALVAHAPHRAGALRLLRALLDSDALPAGEVLAALRATLAAGAGAAPAALARRTDVLAAVGAALEERPRLAGALDGAWVDEMLALLARLGEEPGAGGGAGVGSRARVRGGVEYLRFLVGAMGRAERCRTLVWAAGAAADGGVAHALVASGLLSAGKGLVVLGALLALAVGDEALLAAGAAGEGAGADEPRRERARALDEQAEEEAFHARWGDFARADAPSSGGAGGAGGEGLVRADAVALALALVRLLGAEVQLAAARAILMIAGHSVRNRVLLSEARVLAVAAAAFPELAGGGGARASSADRLNELAAGVPEVLVELVRTVGAAHVSAADSTALLPPLAPPAGPAAGGPRAEKDHNGLLRLLVALADRSERGGGGGGADGVASAGLGFPHVEAALNARARAEGVGAGAGAGWAVETKPVEGLQWPPAGVLTVLCWVELSHAEASLQLLAALDPSDAARAPLLALYLAAGAIHLRCPPRLDARVPLPPLPAGRPFLLSLVVRRAPLLQPHLLLTVGVDAAQAPPLRVRPRPPRPCALAPPCRRARGAQAGGIGGLAGGASAGVPAVALALLADAPKSLGAAPPLKVPPPPPPPRGPAPRGTRLPRCRPVICWRARARARPSPIRVRSGPPRGRDRAGRRAAAWLPRCAAGARPLALPAPRPRPPAQPRTGHSTPARGLACWPPRRAPPSGVRPPRALGRRRAARGRRGGRGRRAHPQHRARRGGCARRAARRGAAPDAALAAAAGRRRRGRRGRRAATGPARCGGGRARPG